MRRDAANTDVGRAMCLHYRSSEGDVVPPKKPRTCTCPEPDEGADPRYFFRDPHPGGWCRSCGCAIGEVK